MGSIKKQIKNLWFFIERNLRLSWAALMILFMFPITAGAIDISDVPLDTQLKAAAANFMIVLDDSGSMDWEIMTKDQDGLVTIGNADYEYLFNDPAGYNLYTSGNNSQMLTGTNRLYWKTQWSGYNSLYYNPKITYAPWFGQPNASTTTPKSHPKYPGTGVTLANEYASVTVNSDILIDDSESANTQISGSWSFDSVDHWTTSAGNVFKWLPSFTTTGTYEVKVYVAYYDNADTKATYKIKHAGGTTTLTDISQLRKGSWISLGSYTFNAGGDYYVTVERTASSTYNYTVADSIKFISPLASTTLSIPNAHYYVVSASNGKPYLVNLSGGSVSYYVVNDVNNDGQIVAGEISTVSSPPSDVTVASYSDSLQNFANWYQFYRRRMYTAIAAISDIIPKLNGVNVGLYSINQYIQKGVIFVQSGDTTNRDILLGLVQNHLQSSHPQASTPLRKALEAIGQYYHKDDGKEISGLGASPLKSAADGGECQQNFVMIFSDGADNGQSPGIGDSDKDMGAPYQDNYPVNTSDNIYPEENNDSSQANTLADVAMYYYKNDLNSAAADYVPPSGIDTATHQHMVTYSVGFGVTGTLNPKDYDPNTPGDQPYDLYNSNTSLRKYPNWPNYASNAADTAARIDDMWHAAVNGRGGFFSAKNPEELIEAFNSIVSDVLARIGSAASVAINGEEFTNGSVLYQSIFASLDWTGDLKAFKAEKKITSSTTLSKEWSGKFANQRLFEKEWDDRLIATYTGSSGVPFRFSSLTAAQKTALDADSAKAGKMLNFLRGDNTHEINSGVAGGENIFRQRLYRYENPAPGSPEVRYGNKLGDIVHSAPVFVGDMIYVGANDGMLHAFRAADGEEAFAYVPNLVFENLKELTKSSYSHKYYVDLTPFSKKVDDSTFLIGGLGKGGKGIYCLDITNAAGATDEGDIASMVKWEYPSTPGSDPDMGYSFSKPFIVNTNAGWVAIFGNGYNSTNKKAVLYVVNASTGALIRKIDTGAGTDNGMSTPNVVDVDGDNVFDYVYAGDLEGNMWKFNIKDTDPNNWGLSYNSALFKAKDASGNNQPITLRPDVMLHCKVGLPGYMVVFGTGKYLGTTDTSTTSVQTIYGIWDYGDDADKTEFLGSFNRSSTPNLSNQPATVTLLKQEVVFFDTVVDIGTKVRVLSNNKPVWKTQADATAGQSDNPSSTEVNNAGWYFDLPISGERAFQDVIIRDGNIIVISSIPQSDNPCSPGGTSIFHEMDACGGGRTDRPHIDLNQDGELDSKDMMTLALPDGTTVSVPATGVFYPNMVYPPSIMNAGDGTEIKYLSTAAGSITTVRERAEKKGIFYYRTY